MQIVVGEAKHVRIDLFEVFQGLKCSEHVDGLHFVVENTLELLDFIVISDCNRVLAVYFLGYLHLGGTLVWDRLELFEDLKQVGLLIQIVVLCLNQLAQHIQLRPLDRHKEVSQHKVIGNGVLEYSFL